MQPPDPSLLDNVQPPIVPATSTKAGKKALTEDEILFSKKQNDHERSEKVKNVFNWTIIVLIVLAGALAASCLIIRALHLLLPHCRLWVEDDRLATLDHLGQLIITGALGGAAYRYFNKQIDNT